MEFKDITKKVSSYNLQWLICEERRINLYRELQKIKDLDGELAEVGVYQGATSLFIHTMFPDRILHCYDTFQGLVCVSEIDKFPEGSDQPFFVNGDLSCSLENVQKVLGFDKVEYHVGKFPDSFREHDRKFAFIHSDVDTQFGTKAVLDTMFPLLVPGGVILIDDSNFLGIRPMLNDWMIKNGNQCYFQEYNILAGQCAITKYS